MTPVKWKLTSMDMVWVEGWYVKPSISSIGSIVVVMFNEKTDESIVGFANDESEANRFISWVVERNPN